MSSSKTEDTKQNPASEKEKAPAPGRAGAQAPGKPEAQALAVQDLGEQVAAAKKEAAANHDRYVRAVADLENFRRRTVREKEELRLFAASRLLEDLLPALDNLGLGLAAAKQPNADLKALAGGVELVQQQLKGALAAHGLKEINPLGEPFDPHQHEAISHQPSEDVEPEHILAVVRTGYVLNGRLLRPASVIVSSGKPVKEPSR
jgi:molecular chaperone GrpE